MQNRFVRVLLAAALLLLAACSTRGPGNQWSADPPLEPVALGELGTHPLSFKGLVYRIPVGQVIGEARVGHRIVEEMRWKVPRPHSLEFNVAITDGLRSHGYEVRDAADSIFDHRGRGEVKVRYEMAAILHAVQLDFEYVYDRRREAPGKGVGTAEVEVEVQLFDVVEGRKVYQRSFAGRAREEGRTPNPVVPAIVSAILKSVGDESFASALSRADSEAGTLAAGAPIRISACERSGQALLPDDLPKALRAVVEIQVGSIGGTGVIVSPDGWIVTAAHVVENAPEVWVRLDAGSLLPAEIRHIDPKSDLALLRVQGREHPCVPLRAAANKLELGSDVFAVNISIGENREPTITRGVVSGFPIQEGRRFIQTDASLNPGSSGGPLLSPDGSIAGITVAKLVGDAIEGLGLAVPVDDVVRHLAIRVDED